MVVKKTDGFDRLVCKAGPVQAPSPQCDEHRLQYLTDSNGPRARLHGLSLLRRKPRIFAAFGKASHKSDPKDIKHC
jgi:hypothetical protein